MDQIREALEAGKVSVPLLVMIADKSTDMFLKLTRDIPLAVQSVYDIPPPDGLEHFIAERSLHPAQTTADSGAKTHLLAGKTRNKKD